MADDEPQTRRWQRFERARTVPDAIQLLRRSILEIRSAPDDLERRRRLRAIAAEHGLWEQLALLLADEARAHAGRPETAAAFYEELADVHENLDQPLETIAAMEALVALAPEVVAHHGRLAALYRNVGAWVKAADAFEQVGLRAPDHRAHEALSTAAALNRDAGRFDHAAELYRLIVERRPFEQAAWQGLDDVLSGLGRWREVAEVRGARADRAESDLDRAALLRAQARALEQAGDVHTAASVVAIASHHAPDDVSGLVDQADVLARAGRGGEAASILRSRISEARTSGGDPDDVAALQLRLAHVLEESCDDDAGAIEVLDELLAESPAHLPALERITALAATDPDPRVHAKALLRYAAAIPDVVARAAYVAAAGRRLRDAGDLEAAVRILEDAASLAADDPAIHAELVEVRTAAVVEQATAATRAGDDDAAEWRLRAILADQRHHLTANLALVDLLCATDRLGDAAEHMRDTLATMPEGLPSASTARLVHRFAEVMAALGDADEGHHLLREAHRLDRRSLAITLALGESCFARKGWREAALHLGAAAAHPDAAHHAALVVTGLLHAAQAEIRGLRPAKAVAHYEAALGLDPRCAAAWHGLAEAATQRGDLVRAAECFEHEALATSQPAARDRLLDALGDQALEVLADPARAERLWSQISDDADLPVLDKLLALQRRRGATIERAETCARLARRSPDAGARKALLIEGVQALRAGAALDRALGLAEELNAQFPREPDAIVCASGIALAAGYPKLATTWARRLMFGGGAEETRAGLELMRAIGAPLSDDDQRFLDANPPRRMASDEVYAGSLDDDDRRELIDDDGDQPLRDVLAILAEVLPVICPTATIALVEVGHPEAQRITASSETATAALYPQIARALGGPPTLLYTTPHADADLAVLFASPPVLLVGPHLVSTRASSKSDVEDLERDTALRFELGRRVERSRSHRIFINMGDDAFARFVAALRHGFGPPAWASTSSEVADEAERLRARLPIAVRQRLTERLAALSADQLDPYAYIAACDRAADRAGLLACGDARIAVQLAGGAEEAAHLVHLAASRRYLAVRKKLRTR